MEVINFNKDKDVVKKLKEMTTYGPDVGIEAGDNLLLYLVARSYKRQHRFTWQMLQLDAITPRAGCTGWRLR